MSEIGISRTPSFIPQTSVGSSGDGVRAEQSSPQAKISSAKLTPLSTPQPLSGPKTALLDSAMTKSSTGANNTCPSRKEVAQRKLDQASEKAKEAKSVGVDVAKTTFFRKMLSVAFQAVAVGIAAGVTAVTFGAGAPVLALACVSLANSIGDATCAYRNVKNAEAVSEGRPPPYELPGGNSFLANVGYKAATALGASPTTAGYVGTALSVVVGGGLAITAAALSLGATAAPEGFAIAEKASSALSGVTSAYSGLASLATSHMDKEDLENLTHESAKLADSAKRLDPDVDGSHIVEQLGNASKAFTLATEGDTAGKDGGTGALRLGGMLGKLVLK